MKFPTVEKFLCCIKLEWGIFIVAWIYLLFSTVYLIASTIIFIWLIVDYFSLIDLIPESYFRDVVENFQPLIVKFVFIFAMIFFATFIYASRRIMISIKTRAPRSTIPFIIMTLIGTISSLLSILHLTLAAIISGIIMAVIEGYICFCAFSFYSLLKEESVRTQNRRSQYAPTASVQYYSHPPNPTSFKFQVE